MAQWVTQKIRSSISDATRKRTAYLGALTPKIDSAIKKYFNDFPLGEEVTLFVLENLGESRLREFEIGKRKFARVKQDVGLLIAMRLVDIYSHEKIQTYRDNKGKDVSTRAANWEGLEWVNRFTPHKRVDSPEGIRIVLDTSVVRKFIHKDPDSFSIKGFLQFKKNHPISIAEPAWAELVNVLVTGRESKIPLDCWLDRIKLLDEILDPQLPIVPTGRDIVQLSGLLAKSTTSSSYQSDYLKAVWDFTKKAKSSEFSHTHTYKGEEGRIKQIGPLDCKELRLIFQERAQQWTTFIERALLPNKVSTKVKEDFINDLSELVRTNLTIAMPSKAIDQLDLLIRVLATYAFRCNKAKDPYVAKGNYNDAIDFDILFCAIMPAIICTHDISLRNLCIESQSSDYWKVKLPNELLDDLIDKKI